MINMTIRFYERFLRSRLDPGASRPSRATAGSKAVLLLGARQTGKSTLLNHCIRNTRETRIVNLQDRRQRRRYEADPEGLVRELEADEAIRTVLIDEIQKVPALLDDVQYLYDKDPNRLRFYLTGSSARQLKRKSSNLLPGRVHILFLSPVLQAEQRECLLLPLPMGREERFPLRSLREYLIYGSLPGLYHEDESSWAETLAEYVELYLENEIRQESVVQDIGAFLRFLRIAALEAGQFVNYTKLARVVGVTANTLRNFYQVLEDTYVGIRVQSFGRSRKRAAAAPRFLFFDLGVRHVVAELPLNDALLSLDPGHIFEQWVLTELYYRCLYSGKGHRLSTWKTSTGAEVDAVLETPTEAIPIKVKWTESPDPRDARHVETFLDLHPRLSKRGFVVCRCRHRQKLSKRVTALSFDEF